MPYLEPREVKLPDGSTMGRRYCAGRCLNAGVRPLFASCACIAVGGISSHVSAAPGALLGGKKMAPSADVFLCLMHAMGSEDCAYVLFMRQR